MKIVFLEADSLGEDMKLDHFFEIGEVVVYGKTTVEQVPERIAEADAVIVNKLPMNKETLSGAGFLKYIGLTATGVNNIDFDYTNKRGITVTNVAGYSTEVVAQHTFALLFYLLEKMPYYDNYVKSEKYVNDSMFTHFANHFHELGKMTWGIIGLGAIGKRVADLAKAFGCHVIYYSTSGRNTDQPYERVDFEELLKRSDVISLHAPLNPDTEGIMNREAFRKMRFSGECSQRRPCGGTGSGGRPEGGRDRRSRIGCPLSGTYASGKSSLCHQGQQKADYYAAHGLGSGRNPGKADEVCI